MLRSTFCSNCGLVLPNVPPVVCTACGISHWNNPKPCAGAVVEHGQKILMVRRAYDPWNGHWDLPSGFLNENEHPVETAEREVLEESGWTIRVIGFLGIWLDAYLHDETTLNIYYFAMPTESAPKFAPDSREVSEVGWFSPDQLPNRIAFPGHIPDVLRAWQETDRANQLVTLLPDRPKRDH